MRRVQTLRYSDAELAYFNRGAAELAAKVQENLEEFGA